MGHYCFNKQQQIETENKDNITKILFKHGFNKHVFQTDLDVQKSGVDVIAKKDNNRYLIDNKITQKKYNHPTHILLEWDSIWHNSNKRQKIGWIRDPELLTTHILDYNVETKEYFLYDFIGLQKYILSLNLDITKYPKYTNDPNNIYVPKYTQNEWMYTINVFLPRSQITNYLILSGKL